MESSFISKFLLCANRAELPGAEIILCTEAPFWYCQVFKATTRKKLVSAVTKTGKIDISRMMMFYNIAFVPVDHLAHLKKDLPFPVDLLKEMGNFYAVEKSGDDEFESYFMKELKGDKKSVMKNEIE